MSDTLPALPRALLHWLAGPEADEVLADMSDEYARRVARSGAAAARWWVWRQVLGSVPGALRRSWFRATTGFESEADRMRRGGSRLESWIMDARFALRGLRRRPQYVILSVLTLALGIGGTTAVFGIARALLLNPLPYANGDQLVLFGNGFDWSEREVVLLGDAWPGFAGVAAYTTRDAFMRPEVGPAELIPGIASSAELFEVLGVRPLLGRGFSPGDDAVGAEPTVVLSHGFWQQLGGRRDIVGSTLSLDGEHRRVVGVMPPGFWFPDPAVRLWLSTPMRPDHGAGNYTVVGRLEPGRALEAMGDPLRRIRTRLGEEYTYPADWDKSKEGYLALVPLREHLLGPVRPALLATLAGMAVILLMACANVATLMLSQLRGRSSELAVRLALGAGRGRLTQQLLIESALLGLLAGVAGAVAASASFSLLLAALPLGELSRAVAADWTLFLTALAIALGAALLIAMVPVFSLWRGELRDALSLARSGGIDVRGGRLEDALVVGEVALAVLLAASAAVLIRSVANLRAVNSGVETRGIAVIDVTASPDVPQEQRKQHLLETLEALRGLPGVRAAGAVQRLPLRDRGDNWGIGIQSKPDLESSTTALRVVTRDYFAAMGIGVRSGRVFDETDRADSELVMVIDETLAKKYFPGEDPVGQMIGSAIGQGWMRVIGVVNSVALAGLTAEPVPGRYVLMDQYNYTPTGMAFVLKVDRGRNAAAVLEQAMGRIERSPHPVAVRDATTMENVLAVAMGPTRRIMQLMTLLGALALTLGAVGVYGVVSHFVTRRRRDWVIRMALGMKPVAALQKVVGRGTALVAIGCVVGVIAAAVLTRMLASLLYQIDPADPTALIAAAGTLILTGAVAALVPALRASRANPAQVLRDS